MDAEELLKKANQFYKKHRTEKINSILNDELLEEYSNADLYALKAQAQYYIRMESYQKYLLHSKRINPECIERKFFIAKKLFVNGKYDTAIKILQDIISKFNHLKSYFLLLDIYNKQKVDSNIILEIDSKIFNIDSSCEEAIKSMQMIFENENKMEDLLTLYEQRQSVSVDNILYHVIIAYYYYSQAMHEKNNPERISTKLIENKKAFEYADRAIHVLNKIHFKYSKYALTHFLLSQMYFETQEWEASLSEINYAISIDKKNDEYYYLKARICQRLNKKKQVETNSKIAINLGNEGALVVLSLLYKEQKRDLDAQALIYQIIDDDQYDLNVYTDLIAIFIDHGRFSEGISIIKKLFKRYKTNQVEIIEDEPFLYYLIGHCYYKTHDYENAIKYYSKYMSCYETYTFDKCLYERALSYKANGNIELALKDLKRCEEMLEVNINKNNRNDSFIEKNTTGFINRERLFLVGIQEKMILNPYFERFYKIINNIKSLLEYRGDTISHYTSLNTTIELIMNDSPFRVSEATFLNDTSEGQIFFNSMGISKHISDDPIEFINAPFIASFIANPKEELSMWRLYGKQDQEEAKGCKIIIKRTKFINNLNKHINQKVISTSENMHSTLFQVAYELDNTLSYFCLPLNKKKEKLLNDNLIELKVLYSEYLISPACSPHNSKDIHLLLTSIAFLFKGTEYRHEEEVRLIIEGSSFEKNINEKITPPRVYVDLFPINECLDSIILGPKVEKPKEWAASFYYTMQKKGTKEPHIYVSHLPFK